MRARKRLTPFLLAGLIWGVARAGLALPAPDTAVFDVVFVNSSMEIESPAEKQRLRHMDDMLRQALDRSGQYHVIDLAPLKERINSVRDIHGCNGCEIEFAKQAGAQRAVIAWVQKVSDLILNISIRIEDVRTEKTLRAGSVDIRGNTDESWDRGMKYLLEEHVFDDQK